MRWVARIFISWCSSRISALVPWVVFRLGRHLISEKAAWVGAVFAIVNGNLIFLGGVLGMEAISIPLIAVGILFLVEASITNTMSRLKWGGYAGIALGVALLFRNDAIIALPVVALAVAFRIHRPGISLGQGIAELKTVSAGIIAGALVLSSLNLFVLGAFGISNRQLDVSFAQELPDDNLNTARG
jgi:4-amino-4-deoxy-L-arabinose transferase-like glycosyltransferase